MIVKARVNNQGRVVLPVECREAAGIAPGDEIMVEVVAAGELRLRSKRAALKRAQALVAKYIPKDRDLVAELIAERREEAERE
jgi:AbrB family looped-hinge helix DNA binding protein